MTVTTDDLKTYLNDPALDTERAQKMIDRTLALCVTVVSPLTDAADVVVERVAARAYVTTTSSRAAQIAAAGGTMGTVPAGSGGVWLSRQDRADLRRSAGGSNAYTIDTLPADYAASLPWWSTGAWVAGGDWDTIP